jgi:predicted ATP-binding protein involved in virulence
MYISSLELKNFKNFSSLEVDFKKGVNLFVGVNGSGKTSLLEAICIAVGAFFTSQNDQKIQRYIDFSEIKITNGLRESLCKVIASGYINNEKLNWERIKYKDGRNVNKYVDKIKDFGKSIFDNFEDRNENNYKIAPLIVYYSTQRLFKDAKMSKNQKYDVALGRNNGYIQCLEENAIKSLLNTWFKNAVTKRATLQIKGIENIDNILENVEIAIKKMLIYFLDLPENFPLKIYEEPDFDHELFLNYDNEHNLPLSYYSDGFRNLLFLVIDLIWRASQLNPWLNLEQITQNVNGVITIDEIDLHLHPRWQSKAISFLQIILPNVQFFITTHSPTVVANFQNGTLYTIDDNQVFVRHEKYFGKEVNSILRNILGSSDRHIETQNKIDKLFKLIENNLEDDKINDLLLDLKDLLGEEDRDVQKAYSMIEWEKYKSQRDAIHK